MKVSVCISTYNQAAYIESAVRSAFQQSIKPSEIIVSDDCSTDKTLDILNALSLEMPVLKIIRQPINLGIAKNVDYCLRHATGDFIIRLDSDDQLLPDYTEKLIGLLMKFPDSGYAHAAVQEIDQFENHLNKRFLMRKTECISAQQALKEAITGYRVAANIIMYRKEALIAVDYLKDFPNFGEDYYLTASISAAGFSNIYLNEILSKYRVWLDGNNIRQKRKLAEINGLRRVFEEVLQPAYSKQGWGLQDIEKSMERVACNQADCLGWDVYTADEKEELKVELFKLSSSKKVKFFAWMYGRDLAGLFKFYTKSKLLSKSIIKNLLQRGSGAKTNTV